MKNINSRLFKILLGTSLIGATLLSGSNQTGTTPILSLVAIPIVISGIANWRPLEWCARKLVEYMKPLMAQAKISSNNV